MYTAKDVLPIRNGDDLRNKVIAINEMSLEPQERNCKMQLYVVDPFDESLSTISAYRLVDGVYEIWQRKDILGEIRRKCLYTYQLEKLSQMSAHLTGCKRRKHLYAAYCLLPGKQRTKQAKLANYAEAQLYLQLQVPYQYEVVIIDRHGKEINHYVKGRDRIGIYTEKHKD